MIQSVDSFDLAQEISRLSCRSGAETDILMEVNLGEEQKGGIPFDTVIDTYKKIKTLPFIKVCGLMAVLPDTSDNKCLYDKGRQMRSLYDIIRKEDDNFKYLSMGMSNDYLIAVECGSNMIRIGSKIFGARERRQ